MANEPGKGERITAEWGRKIAQDLARNRAIAGTGLKTVATPNGTVISLASPALSRLQPRKAKGDADIEEGDTAASESIETDDTTGRLKIRKVDDVEETVATGLQDCLQADPETGEVTAIGGDQYEILVRVKGSEKNVVSFMPLGKSTGTDPEGTGESDQSQCGVDGFPGGGGGGGEENQDTPSTEAPEQFPGSSGASAEDSDAFPGKIDDCW